MWVRGKKPATVSVYSLKAKEFKGDFIVEHQIEGDGV